MISSSSTAAVFDCAMVTWAPLTVADTYCATLPATVTVAEENRNIHRLRVHTVQIARCVRLEMTILETWGREEIRVFAFEAV